MMFFIFILIYVISIILTWLITYIEEKDNLNTFGDILDITEFFVYLPVLNSIILITYIILLILYKLFLVLKLSDLWNKIRNIKLK
jgi:hypothetical protein